MEDLEECCKAESSVEGSKEESENQYTWLTDEEKASLRKKFKALTKEATELLEEAMSEKAKSYTPDRNNLLVDRYRNTEQLRLEIVDTIRNDALRRSHSMGYGVRPFHESRNY